VLWSVMMIQSQCMAFMPNSIRQLVLSDWPQLQSTTTDLDAIVDHIMTFSLAGMRAMAGR
jgi:hypothetical protein